MYDKLIVPICNERDYTEVTFEYDKDDTGLVFIQSLDKNSAGFYKDLDDQLQAIFNPFVEPVFL